MRLDKYASEHFGTRERARQAILSGLVLVNGKPVSKPALQVEESDEITFIEPEHDFVSRSGHKLQEAFDQTGISVKDQIALDIGASTGGFTQCLLEHGAKKVYALDVGHLQLSPALAGDERVVSMEGVNARTITKDMFDEPIEFISMDVSFISSITILQAVFDQFVPRQCAILIKPQYECTKEALKSNGVIKHPKYLEMAKEKVRNFLSVYYRKIQIVESPITGKKGNQEYIAVCTERRKEI